MAAEAKKQRLAEMSREVRDRTKDHFTDRPLNLRTPGGQFSLGDNVPPDVVWPDMHISTSEVPEPELPPDQEFTPDELDNFEELGIIGKLIGKIATKFMGRGRQYEELLRARKNSMRRLSSRETNNGEANTEVEALTIDPKAPKRDHKRLRLFQDRSRKMNREQAAVEEEKMRLRLVSDSKPYHSGQKWGALIDPLKRVDYLESIKKEPFAHGHYRDHDGRRVSITYPKIDTYVDPLLSGEELKNRREEIKEALEAQGEIIKEEIEEWYAAKKAAGEEIQPDDEIFINSTGIEPSPAEIDAMINETKRNADEKYGIDLDHPEEAMERINNDRTYNPTRRRSEADQLRKSLLLNREARRLRRKRVAVARGEDSESIKLKKKAENRRRIARKAHRVALKIIERKEAKELKKEERAIARESRKAERSVRRRDVRLQFQNLRARTKLAAKEKAYSHIEAQATKNDEKLSRRLVKQRGRLDEGKPKQKRLRKVAELHNRVTGKRVVGQIEVAQSSKGHRDDTEREQQAKYRQRDRQATAREDHRIDRDVRRAGYHAVRKARRDKSPIRQSIEDPKERVEFDRDVNIELARELERQKQLGILNNMNRRELRQHARRLRQRLEQDLAP